MEEMRLIDANALAKSDMAKIIDSYLYNQCNLTVGFAAELMPTIEAEPIRHGRWILNSDENFVCNQCRHQQQIGAKDFCGKCGADMRAEEGEQE